MLKMGHDAVKEVVKVGKKVLPVAVVGLGGAWLYQKMGGTLPAWLHGAVPGGPSPASTVQAAVTAANKTTP